jgi:hypothetical protein
LKNLQKTAGIAAFSEAIIYISAFIFFGAIWRFPSNATTLEKFAFLAENQVNLSIVNFAMYVLFGVFLAIIVLAIYQRLKSKALILSQLAAVFGVIWVCLVIASGMISNIALDSVIALSTTKPEQAMTVWLTINIIVEGIGGGNEFVGGIWVLLLSIGAIKAHEFSRSFNYFGLFIGVTGMATIYPAEILTEIFGLSQIVWFLWLGILMLLQPVNNQSNYY